MSNSTSNPILGSSDKKLTGVFNCLVGTGGYKMEKGYANITNIDEIDASFATFDVTDAVQVILDANTFNEKLGLYKNSTNSTITSSSYNTNSETFGVDSITITSSDFQNALKSLSQIINVGSHSNLNTCFEKLC